MIKELFPPSGQDTQKHSLPKNKEMKNPNLLLQSKKFKENTSKTQL